MLERHGIRDGYAGRDFYLLHRFDDEKAQLAVEDVAVVDRLERRAWQIAVVAVLADGLELMEVARQTVVADMFEVSVRARPSAVSGGDCYSLGYSVVRGRGYGP